LHTTKQWYYALVISKEFQKNIEDFECGKCSADVKGDGYTNHCPQCLWSKHVDVFPGDRSAECRGLMEPIEVVQEGSSYILMHKCTKCAYIKKNKLARNDNMESVVVLAQKIAAKS